MFCGLCLFQSRQLHSTFTMTASDKRLMSIFHEQCADYHFETLEGVGDYPNAQPIDLEGMYFSILQSIQLQLCTPTIRHCMQFRQMHVVQPPYARQLNQRFIVFDYGIILELCTDGFSLKGGRAIQLATLTNLSIPGAENSIEASDIQYLADLGEDRFTRSLVQQTSECEIDLLRRAGMVDIATGECIYPIFVQGEDSKSLQLCLGRGGPRSKSRLIFTRIDASELTTKWKTMFAPICFDAHGAHARWNSFYWSTLLPKVLNTPSWNCLIPQLIPFTKTKSCPHISQHRTQYEIAYKWLLGALKNAGLQNTDWLCAESIRAKNYAPLHGSLRVPIHCLKWYHLYVLEYCEWIKLTANAEFRIANHGRNYNASSSHFILKHIRVCLNIPFGYDPDSPSKSRIAAEGGWRRKLWTHLEDVVWCSKCGFRPWKGSPIEPYITVFWVSLIEIMVPTEILHYSNYEAYFLQYLDQKFIRSIRGNIKYQTASVWSIYSKQWFVLFMKLFGNWRMTRYVHGLVYCTQHGFEVAHSLQLSFRCMFGEDVVERMNGSCKGTILGQTPRFGGRYLYNTKESLKHAMKVQTWIRYKLRETSDRLSIAARQHKYLVRNQKKADRKNMALPNKMRKECHRRGLSLKLRCPLSNQFQRRNVYIRRCRQHKDYISFQDEHLLETSDVSDEDDVDIRFEDDDEKRDSLETHLLGRLDQLQHQQDEQPNIDDTLILDDSDSGSSDPEYDTDLHAKLSRKFNHLAAVAYAGPRTEIVSTTTPHQRHQFESGGITWTPFALKLMGSDWYFGAHWIRLTTFIQRGGTRTWRKHTFTWKYQLLFKIVLHEQGDCHGILMKMAGPPTVEMLKGSKWHRVNGVPSSMRILNSNGLISIWIRKHSITKQSLTDLIMKYKYFTRFHRAKYEQYRRIASTYSDEERRAALNAYRGSRTPLMSMHATLVDEIEDVLRHQRLGGSYKCASCLDNFGWFERHSICMDGGEEVHNITENLYEKLLWGNFTESNSDVRLVEDPDGHASTDDEFAGISLPQSVIAEDPRFWGVFLQTVYTITVQHLLDNKRTEWLNCRVDSDWAKITIPVSHWIGLLDQSMCRTIESVGASRVNGRTDDEYVVKIVEVVSRLFIIPKGFALVFGSEDAFASTNALQRWELYDSPEFAVRFRHHYIQGSEASPDQMVFMVTKLWREICEATLYPFRWSFGNFFDQ